ncbi:MAG: PAS domain S-box protein [Henriciella sp.]|nr:PAS domain S-box protein [Henriciella sp.]
MANSENPRDMNRGKEPYMSDAEKTLFAIERDNALRNAVIDAALDCIIMMDQDGQIVEFNPAAEGVFGYTRDEAVGAMLADLIIPENLREAHHSGLSHYLKTGEHAVLNKRIEIPATNKSGDELLVELAISPVEFGGTKFFSAYLRDITETKAAQEQLRASEERFQSLFELSPDAIVVINGKGELLDANSLACELAGYGKEEMLKMPAVDFVAPDNLSAALSGMTTAGGGETVKIQIEFLDANKKRVPTEVLGRRIESEKGALYYGVIRDISDRLAKEQQLRDSKDAAEKANSAKSDFLANMSHEMRTPLNGVIGSLSLVERAGVSEQAASLITAAERSAETLLTLIDDLLDLSRIEAGEIEVENSVFDPRKFSTLVSEVFGPLAEKKQLELNTTLSFDGNMIRSDVGKIRQVLINLVGNAIKFTQRGSINVNIGVNLETDPAVLTLEVCDSGIGISKFDQAVLFDRFKQADSSRSKSHGGAGLGLAICKQLAEIMDGSISVSSAPGVGSTFTFMIPVEHADEQSDVLSPPAQHDANLRGRVLIAEDSETNAMVAMKMLERLGLEFEHVTDGAAAVDAALSDTFDLVLMDVSMPTLDGLEATRILRDRGYTVPIIAMTAHALKGDRDQAFKVGMSGYVTKPVRPNALRDALGKWLSGAPAPADAEETNFAALDTDAIREVWEGDLETYTEIGRIFLDELAWRIPGLSNANVVELEHHAHSLKGAASNIGATELSRLAAELESLAKSGAQGRIAPMIKSIEFEAARVREALEEDYLGAQ